MDKELYEKIEERLFDMFDKIKDINRLQMECENLVTQCENIREDIQSTNVDLGAYMHFGIDYSSLNVQVSKSTDSYMDKELLNAISRLEKEWSYVRRKLIKKRAKIRELERNIQNLKCNINLLNLENKMFIELVYRDKKSVSEAGNLLSMSQATAYRRLNDLLIDVAHWIKLV